MEARMTREEARQLLDRLEQLPEDIPEIDRAEVAKWIAVLTDPDDRIIERKLYDLSLQRIDSRIASLIAGLTTAGGPSPQRTMPLEVSGDPETVGPSLRTISSPAMSDAMSSGEMPKTRDADRPKAHAVPVFTPRTLADRWSCSERHVRNLIETGELQAFRLGEKLLRISEEAVREFERAKAVSANQ
jgi:excisionase family DNA binding protein